ncbi:hypothetical protein [Streptomyces sp. bgisy027]|uniref:hypothetical protein n=1 Tax=Streptomyces sp. bgisy027 TaxID=3413770 RepID=UPI003D7369B5
MLSRPDDGIGEFIPECGPKIALELAEQLDNAARDGNYVIEAAYALYPPRGRASTTHSRHFTNPAATKVLCYTIECDNMFPPASSDTEQVIREAPAALLALALSALEITDGWVG